MMRIVKIDIRREMSYAYGYYDDLRHKSNLCCYFLSRKEHFMLSEDLKELLAVYTKLTMEHDREALLTLIVDTAMELASCDAGVLYLLDEMELQFSRIAIRSLNFRQGGHDGPITAPPIFPDFSPFCSTAFQDTDFIAIPDVHCTEVLDRDSFARYDAVFGYNTHSTIIFPLRNDRKQLIGILQLSNALSPEGESIPFNQERAPVLCVLASFAAVSLTNMQYAEHVHDLLDSLVGSLSIAIDKRIPYNANHTRSMIRYATTFLDWLEESDQEWQFSPSDRRAFMMSIWLHDIGKIIVPHELMEKESRLSCALSALEQRFTIIGLLGRIAHLEGRISSDEADELNQTLTDGLALIRRVNRVSFLTDEDLDAIHKLAGRTYLDENGVTRPWLTPFEVKALSIRKGTLTEEERKVIEDHVSITARILEHVSFPEEYAKVPEWASSHHELLNGTGYPNHRTADDLPREVRLLTILDVFDALTANDRPYKPPLSVADSLTILHNMVDSGSLDGEILSLFEQSHAWEATTYDME